MQRTSDGVGGEAAGSKSGVTNQAGCLAAVGGVFEHVVDEQQSAGAHPGRPSMVVGEGVGFGVAAVEEHGVDGSAPPPVGGLRGGDDHCDEVLGVGVADNVASHREGFDLAGIVNEGGVVIVPTRLVFFATAMVVKGDHLPNPPRGGGCSEDAGGKEQCGAGPVRADFEH